LVKRYGLYKNWFSNKIYKQYLDEIPFRDDAGRPESIDAIGLLAFVTELKARDTDMNKIPKKTAEDISKPKSCSQ
jgi:pantothenate kinase